jgi:hypothetical protein
MNGFKKTISIAAAVSLVCLSSVGAMAANKLIVMDGGGTVQKFVVTETGSVGIGTNGTIIPTRTLEGYGTNASILLQYNATPSTAHGGGGGALLYHNNNSGALPVQFDRLGYFFFGAFDPNSSTHRPLNAGGVAVYASGNWTSDGGANYSVPTYLTFETADVPIAPATGSVRSEKLRVLGNGNIGIGTTAPTSKLQVVGLPVYANQTAATGAGLTAGAFYRTGTDPDQVCVVH